MNGWADEKHKIIQALVNIGFLNAPNEEEILYFIPKSKNGCVIKWIWSFTDKPDNPTVSVHTTKRALSFNINITSTSKFITASIINENKIFEIYREKNVFDSENVTRFVNSILGYFRTSDMELDSHSISIIFGKNSFFYRLACNLMKFSEAEILEWKKIYQELYDDQQLDDKLFLVHNYMAFLLKLFIIKQNNSNPITLDELEQRLSPYPALSRVFLSHDLFLTSLENKILCAFFHVLIPRLQYKEMDLFTELYQELISLETRHPLGEVYSPISLIKMMINKKVTNQLSFLDPSCGTGSFLIELYLFLRNTGRLQPSIRIYGIDINPLSVLATVTNFAIIFAKQRDSTHPEICVLNVDALSLQSTRNNSDTNKVLSLMKEKKVDLIIGNPPWINISGIYKRENKEKLKLLAKKLHILYPIESKNTEICTLFFNQTRDLFLKKGGDIFFILPASVLNGRQHVYFRYFPNFTDIEIWRFTRDIFKIHSICVFAKNAINLSEKPSDLNAVQKRLTLISLLFEIKDNGNIRNIEDNSPLIPIYIKYGKYSPFPLIGRYNPLYLAGEDLRKISPQRSEYYKMVRGGLRIVPRRWVVVRENPPFAERVIIHPDLSQQAKIRWANPPYTEFEVESRYIHAFLKSENLIPFSFVDIKYAFIPIVESLSEIKKRNVINSTHLAPKASKFYQLLDIEYQKRIKSSASMKNLADNFTYNNRLLPTNILLQDFQLLVVHNSIGSIVKSAIVRDPILLDNSLYYVILDDIDEAYYLCGVLNSNVMTKLVRMIGSTGSRGSLRNIHKNPYNFPIPHYVKTCIQIDIANIARKMEKYVLNLVFNNIESSNPHMMELIENKKYHDGPRTIQKRIFADNTFQSLMDTLDSSIKRLLIT